MDREGVHAAQNPQEESSSLGVILFTRPKSGYCGKGSFFRGAGCWEVSAGWSALWLASPDAFDIEASSDCRYFAELMYPWMWSLLMALITTSAGWGVSGV